MLILSYKLPERLILLSQKQALALQEVNQHSYQTLKLEEDLQFNVVTGSSKIRLAFLEQRVDILVLSGNYQFG